MPMPSLGLLLSLDYLPTIGVNTNGGNLPVTRLADTGAITISGRDGSYPITYLADNGAIALIGRDATFKVSLLADNGLIQVSGFDANVSGADAGFIVTTGRDATAKVGIRADAGIVGVLGADATTKVGIRADGGSVILTGQDARTKVSVTADFGGITVSGNDTEWEEDFVAVYSPVNVLISANSQNSSAFSIPGKIIWIDVPVTVQNRTCTLQTLAADGNTWISTGISWNTSSSVNGLVNSETLAKISGKTGEGLNNFRLSYDSSLTGNSTHIVRSRT